MSKVTSKLQVTIPRAVADAYGIEPGDDIEFVPAGDAIRVTVRGAPASHLTCQERVEMFKAATRRQHARQKARPSEPATSRGWKREDLYDRGRTP